VLLRGGRRRNFRESLVLPDLQKVLVLVDVGNILVSAFLRLPQAAQAFLGVAEFA
jgi:hypothetical protein